MLVFALLCVIWGTTWSVIQIGLRGVPPFTGVAVRFALAGSILLGLALARRVPLGRSRREIALWLVNSLFSFTISYGVVYWAEQWVPSGLAAVLFATYPLWVALLAHLVLPEEAMQRAEVAGIVIGFAGVATIFSADFERLGGTGVVLGSLVMLAAPLVSAVASVAIKRWGGDIHPFSLTAAPMLGAAAALGALAWATERGRPIDWDTRSVAALAYLTLAGSVVAFSLYYRLLAHMPAKRLALISYIVPVVAMAIGLGRGEPLTARTIAGSLLVIGGVALAVSR